MNIKRTPQLRKAFQVKIYTKSRKIKIFGTRGVTAWLDAPPIETAYLSQVRCSLQRKVQWKTGKPPLQKIIFKNLLIFGGSENFRRRTLVIRVPRTRDFVCCLAMRQLKKQSVH